MKQLEIPYNFDKDLITFLKIYNPSLDLYHCIYCPPYRGDYKSAKYYTNIFNEKINEVWNFTREQYVSHIKNIEKQCPNKLMLLLQQNDNIMGNELLDWYINLGFKKFCVGSIQQAKVIKNISKEFEVVASITMKISPEQFKTDINLEKYFDKFVLWFPYNRDLETIKNLPKKYKYILLVNCSCNKNCDGTHHWFADKEVEDNIKNTCPNVLFGKDYRQRILIRPTDLPVFNHYIDCYKLQGREYKTQDIIKDIVLYSTYYKRYEGLDPNPNLYYKDEDVKYDNFRIEV